MDDRKKRNLVLANFAAVLFFFYLFVYNSGYGYDALEYLVIGRSLTDGHPFYAFVPSRSWALYYILALFFSIGNFFNHYAVSFLVTLIYAGIISATFFVVRKRSNYRCALISSILVGICGVFMELNFLISEGFVYIFGLLSFYYITKEINRLKREYLILAGLWIGIGCAFKTVALFYFMAGAFFIAFWHYLKMHKPIKNIVKGEFYFTLGLFTAIIIPALYFFFTNRGTDYFQWTYYFPMLRFPSNTEWFYKLYTKLLWFPVLLFLTFLISLKPKLRKTIYSNPNNMLLIFLGGFSSLALFKLQASHYLFPAAAFFSIYISEVWNIFLNHLRSEKNKVFIVSIIVLIIISFVLSISLYRPSALKRLVEIKDYTKEERLKNILQKYVSKDENALFFKDSMYLYWVSERYPNIPFIHFDVQAKYGLEKYSKLLLNALEDPNLVLVEFNPKLINRKNISYFQIGENKNLLRNFYKLLQKYFVKKDIGPPDYVFWVRQEP